MHARENKISIPAVKHQRCWLAVFIAKVISLYFYLSDFVDLSTVLVVRM